MEWEVLSIMELITSPVWDSSTTALLPSSFEVLSFVTSVGGGSITTLGRFWSSSHLTSISSGDLSFSAVTSLSFEAGASSCFFPFVFFCVIGRGLVLL